MSEGCDFGVRIFGTAVAAVIIDGAESSVADLAATVLQGVELEPCFIEDFHKLFHRMMLKGAFGPIFEAFGQRGDDAVDVDFHIIFFEAQFSSNNTVIEYGPHLPYSSNLILLWSPIIDRPFAGSVRKGGDMFSHEIFGSIMVVQEQSHFNSLTQELLVRTTPICIQLGNGVVEVYLVEIWILVSETIFPFRARTPLHCLEILFAGSPRSIGPISRAGFTRIGLQHERRPFVRLRPGEVKVVSRWHNVISSINIQNVVVIETFQDTICFGNTTQHHYVQGFEDCDAVDPLGAPIGKYRGGKTLDWKIRHAHIEEMKMGRPKSRTTRFFQFCIGSDQI